MTHEYVIEYFEAWNRHETDDITAQFAEGGTYEDPNTDGPLSGPAICTYAQRLFEGFPDVEFEREQTISSTGSTTVVEWTMRGTNTGPYRGLPPTRERIELPGVDIIEIEDDGLTSVRGHFDTDAIPGQIGHNVSVRPESVGPVVLGESTRLNLGNTEKPGAFSLTSIGFADEADRTRIHEDAEAIAEEMVDMPGVISAIIIQDRDRGYTITAWEDAEKPRQLLAGGAHKDAMDALFRADPNEGHGTEAMTSIWVPERFNTLWVRCESCGTMNDANENDLCRTCGTVLPERPPYW